MNNDQPRMRQLEEMINFCKDHKYIYIYGHAHDQLMLKKYLNMVGFEVHGFVLSDDNYDIECDCKCDGVIKCSEFKDKYYVNEIGIIIATWDLYFNEIIRDLISCGVDMCNIYLLPGWNKRTISHKMTPRPKERMWIEVNLADHCNLNCQMCDHFSPLAEPTFLNLENFKKDMTRLAELTDGHIDIMKLQGGFQRAGQLIRTGCAARAALNALEAGDGLLNLHALDQSGNALRIAHAAADETALGHDAVFHFIFDGAAAGAAGLVRIHGYVPPDGDMPKI